jgi:GcrA cell cycle regulator
MWWVAARENRMEWTAKAIDLLRALWAEGHSTAEIGRRMGVTKNAIVGKAHRLDLPARPSPIRKQEVSGAPAAPRRKPVRAEAPAAARRRSPSRNRRRRRRRDVAGPAASARCATFPRASMRSCCWPIGEPGQRDFRFCAAEAAPGRPYCAPTSPSPTCGSATAAPTRPDRRMSGAPRGAPVASAMPFPRLADGAGPPFSRHG